jgi:hypothetical protein
MAHPPRCVGLAERRAHTIALCSAQVVRSELPPSAACIALPPASLPERLAEWLAQERDSPELRTVTQRATTLERSSRLVQSSVQADGVNYEMLALTCLVEGAYRVVGGIALSAELAQRPNRAEAELLSMLAAHGTNAAVRPGATIFGSPNKRVGANWALCR